MSAIDLDAVEALCAAATGGSWVEDDDRCVRAPDDRILYDNSCKDDDNGEANAAFIAAARTLVPQLVARVRELEAGPDDAALGRVIEAIEAYGRKWLGDDVEPTAPVQLADTELRAAIRAALKGE